MRTLEEEALGSLQVLAAQLRGLRVLLWGFSGRGFPGGDGAAEAIELLPRAGIEAVWTHQTDPDRDRILAEHHDVAIIANTRIGALLGAPVELWSSKRLRALAFWDLRPGAVAATLRGKVDRVFLTYNGPWRSPQGAPHDPAQWSAALGCPVGYAPQASPLRAPAPAPDGPRVLFVGDLANSTYHQGRRELCARLSARVMNAKDRPGRLAIEARLPELYPSARYVLSTSPLAPGYTSVRTYSILACGGLLILQRFPGTDRLFSDGRDAIIFDDVEDLLPRLAALDEAPEERSRIAESGRKLHAERHTLAHRIVSMCLELVGASSGFSGWL